MKNLINIDGIRTKLITLIYNNKYTKVIAVYERFMSIHIINKEK
jgi:hypothetical protein